MKIEPGIKLDFSDVLIRPKRSMLSSRSEVSLTRTFNFKYSKRSWSGIPIMVSNMDTVGTVDMFCSLSTKGLLTCLHKYIEMDEVIAACESGRGDPTNLILSTGISEKDYAQLVNNVFKLKDHNIDVGFICIDVANGYMFKLVEFCKKMREQFPNITLIAGNVVSREMTEELILNGKVDIVKVGIGSGSVCTTRLQTGVGMPQLSAIMECADAAHGVGGCIISDGGAVVPGDLSKAFGAEADFVMSGSMFAGHTESAGELIEEDGVQYKLFYGMSSDTAMNKYHGGVAKYRSPEGKTVKIKYRGDVSNTVENMLGGIRSTCTYVGAHKLKDLPKCTTFMRVNNQVNNIYTKK
tara:strand:+ start:75 stop:1130 length:1056 start_codon:yes stop_codon:yes gene_type:complete